MADRYRQVQDWLEVVFAGEDVPEFEIQASTIDVLYHLMQTNATRDSQAAILTDDCQQKAMEYNLEAERIAGVLQRVGVPPSSLSNSGAVSLKTLTKVTDLLLVKDSSDTSLLLGLTERSQKLMELKEEQRREKLLTQQLLDKTRAALLHSNALDKSLKSLEDQMMVEAPQLHKKQKHTGFLQKKGHEYKKTITALKNDPSLLNTDPAIQHGALLKRAEELQALKEKLHPMKAKLDSYHKLPADTELTQVKVEEAKQELLQLEKQLSAHVDLIHM